MERGAVATDGKRLKVCVTGASGTFGAALLRRLAVDPGVERLVGLSRDEHRQAALGAALADCKALRLVLGDVRDRERLEKAFWSCDAVIHAAALKMVDLGAYNPTEIRKTNIEGSANVTEAAVRAGVGKVLMLSSDKAAAPQTIYGVSKAQMEAEAIAANSWAAPRGTLIACTRWGNVAGSRGSVMLAFQEAARRDAPLRITDETCTRFWLTIEQAVDFALGALDIMRGGELFIPVLPAATILDVARALAPEAPVEIMGLRYGGEKIHEVLISAEEARRTVGAELGWVVNPSPHPWRVDPPWEGEPFPAGAVLSSDAVARLSAQEIREMAKQAEEERLWRQDVGL